MPDLREMRLGLGTLLAVLTFFVSGILSLTMDSIWLLMLSLLGWSVAMVLLWR